MSHDLVIRGGSIVDGTGADPYAGDIAIDGDRISQVGGVAGRGDREIDADGAAVTPGFFDLHTHLDAQVGWDPLLTPSSWHGVTTLLIGNCGVGFAPCKPADREFLSGMMESVEDIPREAILSGLPWDWESFGGYLDSVAALLPAINVAGLVGHAPMRFYVMGERSIEEQPSPDEIRQLAELAGRSVEEGAFGFSTNRLPSHVLPDGRSLPGTDAPAEELLAIAAVLAERDGLMQTVINSQGTLSDPGVPMGWSPLLDREMDLVEELARQGSRILFHPLTAHTSELGDGFERRVRAMLGEGLDITGVTIPRPGGCVGGLPTTWLTRLWQTPAWNALRELDFEGRLAAIRDETTRKQLVKEAAALEQETEALRDWFFMGDGERPVYTQRPEESLYALASAAGEHPVETWLRISLETDGRALFHMRDSRHGGFNWNLDTLAGMIASDWALPGLGDAGAHVSQIMDSGWTTFVLSHWHRDAGVFSLAEAVRRLTSAPARVLRLADRGTLAAGKRADVNVIDVDRVEERMPRIVHDFPGAAPRFVQRAVGFEATVCNGRVILRHDEHTGERGGEVLRS